MKRKLNEKDWRVIHLYDKRSGWKVLCNTKRGVVMEPLVTTEQALVTCHKCKIFIAQGR